MIKIFYFSGTGNSLWSAKKLAQVINQKNPQENCSLFNIGAEAQKSEIVIEADAVIFVFPSYAYGLPLIVRRFAKSAVFKTPYIASLVTYGSSPCGTLGALRRILKKKGIGKLFFVKIPAVENYLAMFGTPKAQTVQKRVAMQERATIEAAIAIMERRENKASAFYPFSAFVSMLFSLGVKIFYKHYKLSADCRGCGVCEKLCPVSAIVMKDGKPVFTNKCEHCQGCVNMCPLRAISFGRVKFGTPGYHHPEIAIGDLTR
jgi:ferredoxin